MFGVEGCLNAGQVGHWSGEAPLSQPDKGKAVNTTPCLRTFRTFARVIFSSVAQDLSHQVSSECLCLDKTTIFTFGTPSLTRSRCRSLI